MKNPWFQPKPGVLQNSDIALDRLLAKGTVMGACGVALRGQSRRLAANAGVTAEEALKEWTANLIPGVTVIPSGTWGVNRAQEAGCTYCAEAENRSFNPSLRGASSRRTPACAGAESTVCTIGLLRGAKSAARNDV